MKIEIKWSDVRTRSGKVFNEISMIHKFDCDKYEHIRVGDNCGGYFLYYKNEKHPLNKDYPGLVYGGMYKCGTQDEESSVYIIQDGKIYEKTLDI